MDVDKSVLSYLLTAGGIGTIVVWGSAQSFLGQVCAGIGILLVLAGSMVHYEAGKEQGRREALMQSQQGRDQAARFVRRG
jgi:hypothetical protein